MLPSAVPSSQSSTASSNNASSSSGQQPMQQYPTVVPIKPTPTMVKTSSHGSLTVFKKNKDSSAPGRSISPLAKKENTPPVSNNVAANNTVHQDLKQQQPVMCIVETNCDDAPRTPPRNNSEIEPFFFSPKVGDFDFFGGDSNGSMHMNPAADLNLLTPDRTSTGSSNSIGSLGFSTPSDERKRPSSAADFLVPQDKGSTSAKKRRMFENSQPSPQSDASEPNQLPQNLDVDAFLSKLKY